MELEEWLDVQLLDRTTRHVSLTEVGRDQLERCRELVAGLSFLSLTEGVAELLAFSLAFALRASAIVFDIRMGPPGEFIRIGKAEDSQSKAVS